MSDLTDGGRWFDCGQLPINGVHCKGRRSSDGRGGGGGSIEPLGQTSPLPQKGSVYRTPKTNPKLPWPHVHCWRAGGGGRWREGGLKGEGAPGTQGGRGGVLGGWRGTGRSGCRSVPNSNPNPQGNKGRWHARVQIPRGGPNGPSCEQNEMDMRGHCGGRPGSTKTFFGTSSANGNNDPVKGCIRTADHHRRRGVTPSPPPPGLRFHSGKNEIYKRTY